MQDTLWVCVCVNGDGSFGCQWGGCQWGRFFLTPRSSPFFLHSLYQNPLLSFVYVVNTVLLKCLLKLWDISGVFNKKIYTLQLYAPDSFYELY